MKCALELIAMKTNAQIKYEEEEARKDEAAGIAYLQYCENAITLCDTYIEEQLVSRAESRSPLSFSFKAVLSKDRLGNENFARVFREEFTHYANGEPSYIAKTPYYAWEPFKAYLADHCIKVSTLPSSYKQYGCGNIKCIDICVSIPTM